MTPDTLDAVLLPLSGGRLLLPQRALAEALPASGLRPANAGAPNWLAGTIVWQALELPVLHVERLDGSGGKVIGDRRARIVVLHAADGGGAPRFAVFCAGHPELLSLRRESLHAVAAAADERPEWRLAQVAIDGRDAWIPDLAALERRLTVAADGSTANGTAS